MPTPQELEAKFWKALKSDRTVMLSLAGIDDGHARPMTAQVEGDHGPIWFFTTQQSALAARLAQPGRAVCTFASKDHGLFASVHGTLTLSADRAAIDRLWNPFVAAWYERGKHDPTLALLKLEPDRGEVWLNDSSLLAGIKMLLGADPKQEYRDKVGKVDLG